MHRREFIQQSLLTATPALIPFLRSSTAAEDRFIMTVNGPIAPGEAGFTLCHEHILVDFIGADKITTDRYVEEDVFNKALPVLQQAGGLGCKTLVECTPAYLGRNPSLLKRLADVSRINIVTNTGYYGAAKEKFLPAHAYTASSQQLADRWIKEWEYGIGDTGIKPGFIKTGVDSYPLSAMQQKLIEAAALTHLATGLTLGVHTGNGEAALEELRILQEFGVKPEAWIWIHAQNEKNRTIHLQVAKAGGWVSFDGLNKDNVALHVTFLNDMKREKLLHKVLISHDAGWYHVGEPGGGNFRNYDTVFYQLMPALQKESFTAQEIAQVFTINPSEAFAVKIRKA